MSDSLWPHEHRFFCASLSPSICTNSSIESVTSSKHLIFSHPLLFPSIFPSIRTIFQWVGSLNQVIKWLELQFHISTSNEYSGLISFRVDWYDLLAAQGLSRVFSSTTIWKHQFFSVQPSLCPALTSVHDYWNNHSFNYMDLCQQSDLSAFNMMSRFVIAFLPRSKHLLILWLQSPSTVILEPPKIKTATASTFSSSICHEVMGSDVMILVIWILCFKPPFLLSFTLIKRLFSSFVFRVVSPAYLRLLIFLPAILIPAYESSILAFCMMYSA